MVDLRHPIVDKDNNNKYIPHTCFLGAGVSIGDYISPYGMILRGANTSGKSTLAKAIGCIIILAQAGYFVPCKKMCFVPYKKIITRLSGNDSLRRGLSSFAVEMKELNTILKNSDEYTLVLGDELCRGTEAYSAPALTIATIDELINRQTTFIFSTHLNNLDQYSHISTKKEHHLQIFHLTSHFDHRTNKLIQDRLLKPGWGPPIYGIDVAKSLGLNPDFMKKVDSIAQQVIHNNNNNINKIISHNPKKSRYSNTIYVDHCEICGQTYNLETHHIEEQHLADKQGYIDHMNKNNKQNTVILCKKCHDTITFGKASLSKNKTTDGYQLIYKTTQ
jgi:DNA mismatch repair protein MutS